MNGRSVLYAPCISEQKRRFMAAVNASELGGLVLDATDEHINRSLDHQLIEAVGFQPGVEVSRFDQLADELVGVRSRLARYLGDLHGVNEQWGISAYQTIQNLATIAVLPTHPSTHVRLSKAAAHAVGEHMDEWTQRLRRAGKLGEYIIGPQDTAWYKASVPSEDEAVKAYQRVADVLRKLLPVTRDQVASTVQTCGFPIPATAQEWSRQVMVLRNLRRVLDVFQPEIFERDIDAMIEASKPKALRKSEGASMGFWERRRHVKEAKGLLRVGAQVENLHEALKVVAKQAEQWRLFVPHGGWPVLPSKLDAILETQESLMDSITSLDTVLATTPQGANLEALDFNTLEQRLRALYEDHLSLDTLPERCALEQEFDRVGLGELVEDLRERHVETDAVEGELQLSWWTTVFEDIVRSSAIISNQDGSALQAAADRFAQVDVEHVRSIGPKVRQEAMRRLCDLLFSRTQEANQLHTVLAGSAAIPLSRIRHDHPQILAAAKPIVVATPPTLAAMSEPTPLCDVAIIDAGAHLPSAQLLSIVSRVRQVVVLAHRDTVTSEGLAALIGMLPAVPTTARPVRRHPALAAFLQEHGYGDIRVDVTTEPMQGHIAFHRIEAVGVPVLSSGLVESSQQEIDEVIRIITQRAASFTVVPAGYVLSVVTLTGVFRTRLGAELKSLAAKKPAIGRFLRHVRLIGINEVTGARANDAIISLCYAKTSHGRLLQQFGYLEGEGGKGMLLDALALADRDVDIVSGFGSQDLDDERLHQKGPRLLKALLQWAEQRSAAFAETQPSAAGSPVVRSSGVVRPEARQTSDNVLFNDLAERIRARGLDVAVDYGFEHGMRIPLVIGLKGRPFALAVLTDDARFMGIQSTRERHRVLVQDLESLGWSVMNVWSVGAFVNPDREVDRVVERISAIYGEKR
jgi:flagellar biosynthesis/type III secretory pathway chaperone